MPKPKYLLMLLIALSLTSCSTITSRKTYSAKFFSDAPNAKAKIGDSIYTLPARVKLKRSKQDLAVTLLADTVTKDFTLKAGPSPQFAFGNLLFMQVLPVAYAADLTNQKRFYYGKFIKLSVKDTATVLRGMPDKLFYKYATKKYPTEKGQIFIELAVPYINGFYLQPRNEPTDTYLGFFGFGAGVSYYYKDNKYVKLAASAAMDSEIPIPIGVYDDGGHETRDVFNFTFTDNFKLNRFMVGYGLNYAINRWRWVNHDYEWPPNQNPGIHPDDLRPPSTKISHSFGVTLNAYHQINRFLHAGVVYSPTFYNVYPSSQFKYQHLISFELLVKLRVRK